MRYAVDLSDDAKEGLSGIGPRPKREVNKVIKRLRTGPDPGLDLRLSGVGNRWRAYAGRRWRVIFTVMPGRYILIQRISRRPGAYEGIEHPGYQDVRDTEVAYVAEEESVPAAAAD